MNFIEVLLQLQNQVRICHWQTDKYSVHKATDKLYNNLDSTIDTFVEQFMGKYGKIRSEKGFSLQLKNIDEIDINNTVNTVIEYLSKEANFKVSLALLKAATICEIFAAFEVPDSKE